MKIVFDRSALLAISGRARVLTANRSWATLDLGVEVKLAH